MNLYHFVPDNMQGTVLYALNDIKDSMPDLYVLNSAKYEGRESIMEEEVPGLGVWNDVIHLSPIDPKEVIAELEKAGAPADFSWKAFLIDAKTLDWSNMVIMTTSRIDGKIVHDFVPFTEESYNQNCHLPEITKQHYIESVAKSEAPYTYGGAPHVLYKGTIETTGLPIITV